MNSQTYAKRYATRLLLHGRVRTNGGLEGYLTAEQDDMFGRIFITASCSVLVMYSDPRGNWTWSRRRRPLKEQPRRSLMPILCHQRLQCRIVRSLPSIRLGALLEHNK